MDLLDVYVTIARELERYREVCDQARQKSIVDAISSLSHERLELTKFAQTLPILAGPDLSVIQSAHKTTMAMLSLVREYASAVPFKTADVVAREWSKRIALCADVTSLTLAPVLQSHLAWTARLNVLAEASLSQFSSENVGKLLDLPIKARRALSRDLLSTLRAHARLSSALEKHPTSVLRMPPQVTVMPSIEHFNATDFAALVTVDVPDDEFADEKRHVRKEIASQVERDLETDLAELDPSLVGLWRGGRDALESDNPDRARQFCISFRELFTHVLHQLAPDDRVKEWSSSPSHLDEFGRPTREARLLYICRNIDCGQFHDFLARDIASVLALVRLLHRGVHEIDSGFTPAQLTALRIRIEAALLFMLETSKADCALVSVKAAAN